MCLESDSLNRKELLSSYRGNNSFDGLVKYFSEWSDQYDMGVLFELFKPEITDLVDIDLNDETNFRTFIQMYISVFMAHHCEIPLIVELERGRKIDGVITYYCERNGYGIDPFAWYTSTTEEDFYKFLSTERKSPTLLFLDKLDSASMKLQKLVYTIFYQWKNSKVRKQADWSF